MSRSKPVFKSAGVQQINYPKKLATEKSATSLGKLINYNLAKIQILYLYLCSQN